MNLQLTPRSLTSGYRKIFYKGPRLNELPPLPRSRLHDELDIDQELTAQIAVHEAGHAIIALVFDQPLYRVWINPKEGTGCCVSVEPPPGSPNLQTYEAICESIKQRERIASVEEFCADEMIMLAAGGIAQGLFARTDVSPACVSDNHKIELLAGVIHRQDAGDQRALIERQTKRAEELVKQHWQAIVMTMGELFQKHEVSGSEVRAIYEAHKPRTGDFIRQ